MKKLLLLILLVSFYSFAINEAKHNEQTIIDTAPPHFLLNMDNNYYSNDHFADVEEGFYIDD